MNPLLAYVINTSLHLFLYYPLSASIQCVWGDLSCFICACYHDHFSSRKISVQIKLFTKPIFPFPACICSYVSFDPPTKIWATFLLFKLFDIQFKLFRCELKPQFLPRDSGINPSRFNAPQYITH